MRYGEVWEIWDVADGETMAAAAAMCSGVAITEGGPRLGWGGFGGLVVVKKFVLDVHGLH